MTGDTFLVYCRKFLTKRKTLMVLDLFAAHRSKKKPLPHHIRFLPPCFRDERVRAYTAEAGVDLAYVPGGCTAMVQVMDVFVNSVFKSLVRKQYLGWKAANIQVTSHIGSMRSQPLFTGRRPRGQTHSGLARELGDPGVGGRPPRPLAARDGVPHPCASVGALTPTLDPHDF